jgi:hypothetical protein
MISAERVAEVMWQRGNLDPPVRAHLAWLALADDERRLWCDRAEAAIADWRQLLMGPAQTSGWTLGGAPT